MEKHLKGHDVLELKARLMDKLITTPWITYMDNFIKDVAEKSLGGYSTVTLSEVNTGETLDLSPGGAWCLSEYSTLHQSESYLIGAQMNALVRQAAVDVPSDLVFEEHIVPSRYGFLVFEEPWEVIDVRGKRLLTRVITWQPMKDQHGRSGVQVTEYTAASDGDEITQRLKTMDPTGEFTKMLGDLQVQHLMPIQFGVPVLSGVDPTWSDLKKNAAVGPVRAIIALWMLMQQRVTETVVPNMTPRSIRRWERKKVRPAVNVINLSRRRIVSESPVEHEQAGSREWSGRWMVRGHWRNQPYGPKRQDRHWIYVHPFLKGPDDKPIIDKRPRVYKLSR